MAQSGGGATRLAIAGVMAALVAWLLLSLGRWPEGLIGLFLQVGLPGLLGLVVFGLVGSALGVPELPRLVAAIRGRFRRP